jgi:hypothetical protein
VCDVGAGHCVQCLVDGDCPAGYLCGGDRQCTPGCKTNQDCGGPKPICDTVTGVCVGCQSNTDCGAVEPVCTTAGTCVQCETNTDCKVPTDPVCTPDGQCAQCNVDTDCKAPLPACNNNVCAQCSGNGPSSYCPATEKCHGGLCG